MPWPQHAPRPHLATLRGVNRHCCHTRRQKVRRKAQAREAAKKLLDAQKEQQRAMVAKLRSFKAGYERARF